MLPSAALRGKANDYLPEKEAMASMKQNEAASLPQLSREEEEKLLAVWKLLKELSNSEYPAIRAGSRKARGEIWQVLFELDLKMGDED